jgi:Pectate lyase superfamily protein
MFNVREFGAKGDGVTDDTSAIHTAIAAMVTGDTLYFPSGVYVISDTLTLGNGTATTESTINALSLLGVGSGGAVHANPSTPAGLSVLRWSSTAPQDRPMLKILGAISSLKLQGLLFDGNARAQDGIWEIYMHGSEWHDVYTVAVLRAHWFRSRWNTNPSGFVEGSSTNVFVNCGSSGGTLADGTPINGTSGSPTLWGLINGGLATDPTDRTSANASDPFDSVFIKCRFRFDAAFNSIAHELRYTDSNVFLGCDFVGAISVGVAQNPNFLGFPTAYMHSCFPTGTVHTVGFHMQTIGTISTVGPGCVHMHPIGDQSNIPIGTYLPWLFAEDEFGSTFFSGYKRRDTLQATDRNVHTLNAVDTAFHSFGLSSTFRVKQGDLFQSGFGGTQGTVLRIRLAGSANTGTSPGSIRIQVLVGSSLIADTGAIGMAANVTQGIWSFDIEANVGAINTGTSTVSLTQQKTMMAFAGSSANASFTQAPLVSGGSTSGISYTADQAITVQAQFSSASSGNSISTTQCTYEAVWADYTAVA